MSIPATPLVCEKCQRGWDYKGAALLDASKRVHCPKCNSTRIIDSMGNKVNKGFKRHRSTPQPTQSENVGVSQQTPDTTIPTTPTIQQHTTTLDLSAAQQVLGQPIPNVQQIKKGLPTTSQPQQQQIGGTGTVQPIAVQTVPLFTGDDFKIIYALSDDFMGWMTQNKGLAHTVQRRREMGELLAKMLNKYGVNMALEIIFMVSHLAYFSPIVFHYYGKKKKKKEEKKPEDAKDSAEKLPETPEEIPVETEASVQAKTVTPKKPDKPQRGVFSKGETKTIGDYMRKS